MTDTIPDSTQNSNNLNYLDFEQPIYALEEKINELNRLGSSSGIEVAREAQKLKEQSRELIKRTFRNLSDWEIVRLARHPLRPYTKDYIEHVFTDFIELHGDRSYADDPAIVGGLARLQGRSVMVIGHQKGRNTQDKIRCNFGMPKPEGYRKALRLMCLAERFNIPILTFIDTPGAYPGIGAEERGQSEAIAVNLREMSMLKVPIICTVIGEGGSGGALAIGVGDHIMMLEFSVYSVISPEGCASILWKNADKAAVAAEALALTAPKLLEQEIIDEIIPEPLGSAHRSCQQAAMNIQSALTRALDKLSHREPSVLAQRRFDKLMDYGRFKA